MAERDPFSWTAKFKWDVLIAVIIATLPFSIYLHLLFDQTNLTTIEFFGFSYVHKFPDTSTFIWMILIRMAPLLFYCVWLFVSPYWWRYFIIVPISANIYSLTVDCLKRPINTTYEEVIIICYLFLSISGILLLDFFIFKFYRTRGLNDFTSLSVDQKTLFDSIKKQWLELKAIKTDRSGDEYFGKLLHLKKVIKLKYGNSLFFESNNYMSYVRKREIVIIAVLILCSFMLFTHKLIPKAQTSISVLWISLDDNGFYEMKSYIWYMCAKLAILIPLSIWFYTSRNWWRYALLSPIILYTYQIWEANQDIQQLDAFGNIRAFPAVFTVVILLVVLSKIYKYRYGLLDMHDKLEKELDEFIEKAASNRLFILKEFRNLSDQKEEKQDLDKYLKKLNDLKQRIQYELSSNS